MKKVLAITLLFQGYFIQGQNLVQNPSFENYSSCPNGAAAIANAIDWYSFRSSCDYYNSCSSQANSSVPSNTIGYQFPHTGNAYAGIITFDKAGFYREAIGGQLSPPLVIGQKYYVSFYVSLSIKAPNCTFAANNMGAKFTNNMYSANPPDTIPMSKNVAQIRYNNIIIDTTNWVQVTGSFIADSTYQYIAIGNFFDDAHTDTLRLGSGVLPIYAYYYIDDVCVSTDSVYANTWTGMKNHFNKNEINIYPNPTNKFLNIACGIQLAACSLQLYDVLGKQIKNEEIKIISGVAQVDVSSLNNGVYFLSLKTSEGVLTKKIIVQH